MSYGTFETTMDTAMAGLRSLIGVEAEKQEQQPEATDTTREGERQREVAGGGSEEGKKAGEIKVSEELQERIRRDEEELEVEDSWIPEVGVRLAGAEREVM